LAISRERKEELTAQYVELINESRAVFLTEYTGLTVKQMEALREEVRKSGGTIHVTKNTLLINALRETGRPVPEDILVGQIATGFALTEAPTLAKTLVDYAKKEEKLTLRGGILGEELLTPAQVQSLASLPSLDELRGQIIGLISAPARNIAGTIASGVRQVVNVLDAYAKKEEAVSG
jgi:large subunit ribosomal protein L10